MAHVRSLTSATFDEALASATVPALVDFYTTWCPPCRALAPVLDKLALEFDGRIAFFKVNVGEEPELAGRFHVRAVPTLALFAGGEQIRDMPGYYPPDRLRAFLESVARAAADVAHETT